MPVDEIIGKFEYEIRTATPQRAYDVASMLVSKHLEFLHKATNRHFWHPHLLKSEGYQGTGRKYVREYYAFLDAAMRHHSPAAHVFARLEDAHLYEVFPLPAERSIESLEKPRQLFAVRTNNIDGDPFVWFPYFPRGKNSPFYKAVQATRRTLGPKK